MPNVSACARRSDDVSMRTCRTAAATAETGCPSSEPGGSGRSISTDVRMRRSRGSAERQTSQSQPIIGTPYDVPVPRRVTLRLNNPLSAAARCLDESQPELVEHLLEHLPFVERQIAACLLFEEREDIDHLCRALEVDLGAFAGVGIGQVAEVDGR